MTELFGNLTTKNLVLVLKLLLFIMINEFENAIKHQMEALMDYEKEL